MEKLIACSTIPYTIAVRQSLLTRPFRILFNCRVLSIWAVDSYVGNSLVNCSLPTLFFAIFCDPCSEHGLKVCTMCARKTSGTGYLVREEYRLFAGLPILYVFSTPPPIFPSLRSKKITLGKFFAKIWHNGFLIIEGKSQVRWTETSNIIASHASIFSSFPYYRYKWFCVRFRLTSLLCFNCSFSLLHI